MNFFRYSKHRPNTPNINISTPLPTPLPVFDSTGRPPIPSPSNALQVPRMVIKSIASHRSSDPRELSFEKGEFFYVYNEYDGGPWYEAHNPLNNARGLVPATMFEEVKQMKSAPSPRSLQFFYATVTHDFTPERPDEIHGKIGDPLMIVACSTDRNWFVAKPIGRLGRPGLIPVSYVEVRDPTTGMPIDNIGELLDGGQLPNVKEWKESMSRYKASSIELGGDVSVTQNNSTRTTSYPTEPRISIESATPLSGQSEPIPPPHSPYREAVLPEGILRSAEVTNYHYEAEEYWFHVHAIFEPYVNRHSHSSATELVLFRSYNDFYDFQVELLHTFPRQAGSNGGTRTLPYLPGPVDVVDNNISKQRREELDEYLRNLCKLELDDREILEDPLVRSFFFPKHGDHYNVDSRRLETQTMDNHIPADQVSRSHVPSRRESDGSRYEDEEVADCHSGQSIGKTHTQSWSQKRGSSALHQRSVDLSHSTRVSLQSYARSSLSSHDPSPVSMGSRSSQAGSEHTAATSTSGRSRSASNAAYNPPISATNSAAAFVKIKIFDRVSGDLVAIRVHPKVTYGQLLDKVQTRLHCEVASLRYRDSLSNESVSLNNDGHLHDWLEHTDRHVLYAE